MNDWTKPSERYMPSLMPSEHKGQHQKSVARYEREKIEANRMQEQKL